jgi:type I restriction-modification system DNA methylase subunit
LQNLFFSTLNKAVPERRFAENAAEEKEDYGIKTIYRDHTETLFKIPRELFVKKLETVPFLNGGLFECLDRPEYDGKLRYSDGFSREKSNAAFVPNCLFFGDGTREGIIELFNRYTFTVEENTPQDIDLALDPELLGKVFENLLGTYNEETKSTARKESGSFYTPREIVNYMVDASIKEYFKGILTANSADLRASALINAEETANKTDLRVLREEDITEKIEKLFSFSETEHTFSACETERLIRAIQQCKILDPACGSGAFPMSILNRLVFILEKLDPDNTRWREMQMQKANKETEEAFRIGNKILREERLKEIDDIFECNQINYGRKLFLIENCLYGVDIQPIAIQISKLRFFISLIADQKTYKENTYALPNLETKFVSADTLIGLKREGGILADPALKEKQKELLSIRRKHFRALKACERKSLREQEETVSKELTALLKKDGFYHAADAQKMADWNPCDQTRGADFFDAYWMFGVQDGFDIVIGNPPYGATPAAETIKYFKKRYKIKTRETAILFIEKGLRLCTENGIQTYIIPKPFIFASNYADIRNYIENDLLQIVDCRMAFEKVLLEQCIILNVKNSKSNTYKSIYCNTYKEFKLIGSIDKKLKSKFGFYLNGVTENEILIAEKILKQSVFLNEIAANIRGATIHSKDIKTSGKYALIGGKQISRYGIHSIKGFVNEIDLLHKGEINENSLLLQNIISFVPKPKETVRIVDCIPQKTDYYINDTINQISITNNHYDKKFIWALLNSALLHWYAFNFIYGKAVMTMHFDNPITSRIPISVSVSESRQQPLITLVEEVLTDKICNSQADTQDLERKIDALVYRLYGLTDDEIRVIEGDCRSARFPQSSVGSK